MSVQVFVAVQTYKSLALGGVPPVPAVFEYRLPTTQELPGVTAPRTQVGRFGLVEKRGYACTAWVTVATSPMAYKATVVSVSSVVAPALPCAVASSSME